MLLGPFDSRTKRSRCSACSASHLKCTGTQPCGNCYRRAIPCVYNLAAQARPIIRLDQAKNKTVANFSKKCNILTQVVQSQPRPRRGLDSSGPTNKYFYFFTIFVQQNTFATGFVDYGVDIRKLMGNEPGQFLVNAATAVGALQSSILHSQQQSVHRQDKYAALQAYSSSITALRDAMEQDHCPPPLYVMWTTMLLGLYELMQDETGDGWLKHMIHGTAQALQASGPSLCLDGLGRSFFRQARLFEVARTLLMSEPTFLSLPEWEDLLENQCSDTTSFRENAVDAMILIIVKSSKLRLRAEGSLKSIQELDDKRPPVDALGIAAEGFILRNMLDTWKETFHKPCEHFNDDCISKKISSSLDFLLSNIFFAAISIYLSGVFDYDIMHWNDWGIVVPTIPEDVVQEHLIAILLLTDIALKETTLSALLFFFPLRIAGARSRKSWQRDRILALLGQIGQRFAVAHIFQTELLQLWQRMDKNLL